MENYIDILLFIGTGRESARTAAELAALTGLTERDVRRSIEKARRHTVILNRQDGNGYYLPDLPEEAGDVIRCAHQENARLLSLAESTNRLRELADAILSR